ncbi:MAG: efflux RND transporter periplasmic adaptor subunit [Candidatus Methylomirabilota bacterium]
MKRKPIVLLLLLLLAGLGGVLGWRWWSRPPEGVLRASGTIEATEIAVSFKIPGRVISRPADEGQRLKPGDLVARLESRELEANVEQLRASLQATETHLPQLRTEITLQEELARARIAEAHAALASRQEVLAVLRAGSRSQDLRRASADVREAKAIMENAQADARRMDDLFRDGGVSAQSRDSAQTAYAVAVERHRNMLEQLDLLKEGPRQEEIRRAEADVRQASASLLLAQTGKLETLRKRQELATQQASVARDRAALAAAEAQLSYTTVVSPQAGVVLRKHVEPGEMIAAGTPAITLADLDNIWLKIYIPEPRLGQVKLGQATEITTDSYPNKRYQGTVTFINSEAEFTPKNVQTQEERVKLVFAVKIRVDNSNQELKPGMPADARLALEATGQRR